MYQSGNSRSYRTALSRTVLKLVSVLTVAAMSYSCSAGGGRLPRIKYSYIFPGDVLSSPKVATAVIVNPHPSITKPVLEQLASETQKAIQRSLVSLGYDPKWEYSEILPKKIPSTFLVISQATRTEEFKPFIDENILAQAKTRGLSGAFVVWISLKFQVPIDAGKTYSAPVFRGSIIIDVYSVEGEYLGMFSSETFGMGPASPGRYHVSTPAEVAFETVKQALRSVNAYSSTGRPIIVSSGLTVNVTDFRRSNQDPPGLTRTEKLKADHEYWLVSVELANGSGKEIELTAPNPRIRLAGKGRKDVSTVDLISQDKIEVLKGLGDILKAGLSTDFKFSVNLAGGETKQVIVVFEMPKSLAESDFELYFLDAPPLRLRK